MALDPDTGEVLALASYPDFDPSLFVNGSQERIEAVIADPDKVLLNRAIGGNYPAGSTFKAVSAAGLEGGFITAGEEVESPPQIEQDGLLELRGGPRRGPADCARGLGDTYFYQLGDEFYRAQESPLQEEARRFGLGERTGLDLPARSTRTRPGSGRTSRARRSPTSTAAGSPGTRSTCRSGRAT